MSGASTQAILGFLGVARAAGALESGRIACEKALARGRVRLLLLAEDAGGDVSRRIATLAQAAGVRCYRFATKATLGQAIGRPDRSVVGVLEPNIAQRLVAMLQEGGWEPIRTGSER